MLRIAYCSSSKHTTTSTLLTAIKSVADAVDRPLLARARGGDGDTLQKLGLDLALFVRAGQDPREDVTHVIRATRFDPGSAFSTRSDTACELLAADVRLSDGKTHASPCAAGRSVEQPSVLEGNARVSGRKKGRPGNSRRTRRCVGGASSSTPSAAGLSINVKG